MPNHITTLCTITGDAEKVEAFRVVHITAGEESGKPFERFDFETIVPKPQCVKDTERGWAVGQENVGDAQVELYARALLANRRHFLTPSERFPWMPADVQRWGDVITWLDRTSPGAAKWGRASLVCAAETGYPGWYEWSCANWGTKWGSYQYKERERSPGRFVFDFQTAWSVPVPILNRLADIWPELLIETESIDEGGGEYVGRFHGVERSLERVPDDDARYLRVYGEPRPTYDDEDDASA